MNYRLLPGDTVRDVVEHARRAIGDERIVIEVLPQSSEASPVASQTSEGYGLISRTVRELFPGVIVAPGLMIGGTDERISVENYVEMIRFYETLIRHAAGAATGNTQTGF